MWKSIPFSIWRKILFRKNWSFHTYLKLKKKKKTKILLFKYLYQNEKYSSSKSVYQNQCFFRECMCKKSREIFLVASKCFKNNDFTFRTKIQNEKHVEQKRKTKQWNLISDYLVIHVLNEAKEQSFLNLQRHFLFPHTQTESRVKDFRLSSEKWEWGVWFL